MRSALAAWLLLALAGCALSAPAPRSASYANPVLDEDFPDPAVLRADDGFYYVYATQSEHDGHMLNIQVARSRDLVAWAAARRRLAGQTWLGEPHPGFLGAARREP